MSATLAAAPTPTPAPIPTSTPQVTEKRAHSVNGWPVVILGIVGIIGCAWAIGVAIAGAGESFDMPVYFWASIVALILIIVLLTGLTPVAPGRPGWCSCSAATSAPSARTACAGSTR